MVVYQLIQYIFILNILTSYQVPFSNYFKVSSIQKYTDAIGMEEFMQHLAPTVWPEDKRIG